MIYNDDCMNILPTIEDNSIDLILCDMPYQETGNKWDKAFPLEDVCKQFERIIKEDGCIALTGTFRFGVKLFELMPHLYKYDWIWEKDNGTNAPNVNLQPFRVHEQIFIFGKGRVTNGTRIPMKYNPQKTKGKPYCQKSGKMSDNWKGGLGQIITDNKDGMRHPLTIQKFNRDKNKLHPTQKPLAMMEFLINTYTNPGDVVLDCCMGSGSTGLAALRLNRKFIGVEKDLRYFNIARDRLSHYECKIDISYT